ncbi:MAG: alpha/beta hydrolase [Clostridia bacterium]|nr:alpha/beta hydrolase [Clostridia bacterium]
MQAFEISLQKEGYSVQGGSVSAILADEPFDLEDKSWKRPAVLVVPGGAYLYTSKREGEPVALDFLSRGFQAFVLHYQTATDGVCYPEQLIQIASAVDCIKKHAKEWRINADEVFVVGFSAGGHLTGNLAVAYDTVSQKAGQMLNCKPTAIGLGYPVISQKYKYQDTHKNLLQGYTDEAQAELYKELNLDEMVTANTPPAYIWTTATDSLVPPENAMQFALSLARKGVSYELHVYSQGEHGLSCSNVEVNVAQMAEAKMARGWMDECIAFFKRYVVESI